MRVLFCAVPEAGHLHPLLPLAQALKERGHQVVFASSQDFARRAERAGFEAFSIGDELQSWFGDLTERVGGPPGEGLPPEEIELWFTPRLFAQVGAEHTVGDLVELVGRWGPDLIIHDIFQYAAPLAAALAGVPNVAHGVGPLPAIAVLEAAGEATAALRRTHGVDPVPYGGIFAHAFLSISPGSLNGLLPETVSSRIWPLRPVGYDARGTVADVPRWLDQLPDRDTIYATLGTFLNSDQAVFRAILDGLADENLNLIVTVGENNDPAWLDPIPDNARVERYIPQSLLLDRCAALVCHGGSGTILPALTRAIPLLLLPQGADNFTNASRCKQIGVGRTLGPAEVSAANVREGTRRILDDSIYRKSARRVASEITAMPEPA